MKYRYKNPEVFVEMQVSNGPYTVTHPDGSKEILNALELATKYTPALERKEVQKEMYRKCTEIIDLEQMIDNDAENAESLLADAVTLAKQIRGLIQ